MADKDGRCGGRGGGGGTEFEYLSFAVIQFKFISGHPVLDFSNAVLHGVNG